MRDGHSKLIHLSYTLFDNSATQASPSVHETCCSSFASGLTLSRRRHDDCSRLVSLAAYIRLQRFTANAKTLKG